MLTLDLFEKYEPILLAIEQERIIYKFKTVDDAIACALQLKKSRIENDRLIIPIECKQATLTKDEKAYRRGALQSIIFLKTLYPLCDKYCIDLVEIIASYEQSLLAGRENLDPKFLGHYLDEIINLIKNELLKLAIDKEEIRITAELKQFKETARAKNG